MIKSKNLYFTSAAIFLAAAAATKATAADPIIIAEPVNYVRICDAFGAGFFYIPGSNTCLKISGYARAEASWVQEGDDEPETYYTTADFDPFPDDKTFDSVNAFIDSIELGVTSNPDAPNILTAPLGATASIGGMTVGGVQVSDDAFDNFTTRARGEVQFDARTETDMGILRSYVALRGTIGHNSTSDDFSIDKAFLTLQNDFGTFTAGHILSFFDFFGGYSLNSRVGGDDPTNTTNLFGYTFNAGNGFSASISVEDRRQRQNDLSLYPVYDVPSSLGSFLQQSTPFVFVAPGPGVPPNPVGCPGGLLGVSGCADQLTGSVSFLAGAEYEGQEIPDFVANIRIDQGWGSAQIMGGLRQVKTSYGGDAFIRSSDLDRIVNEDLKDLANSLTSRSYPANSSEELGWVVGAGLTAEIPGTGIEASIQGAYTEGMVGYVTTGNGAVLADALTVGTDDMTPTVTYDTDLTKAWSIIAGIKADLTSAVEVRLNGTYADVDHAGSYFDYNTWTAAGTVLWRPVEGLSIGGEISYERIDGDVYAAGDASAGSLPTPIGVGDGDLWGALFRVTRSF